MAIQGKLVPQNPGDEPASVLLERIRAEKQRLIKEGKIKKDKSNSVIFKGDDNRHYEKIGGEVKDITDEIDIDLPDGWTVARLGSLLSCQTGASFKKDQASNDKTKIRILRGGNISDNGYKFYDNDIFIDYSLIAENIMLRKNDLITPAVTSLENVGKIAIIEKDYDNVSAGGFVFICRPFYSNDILGKFLLYALQSPYLNSQIKSITKKSGQAFYNIGKERLIRLLIPIPPLAEQERIVAEIEKYEPLIAEYDKLEQEKSKLDGEIYDKLKKSILQYAIQGKLVPQEPTDEPASVLLEKIRAEKKAKLGKKYVDSFIYKGDDNCYYEHIDGVAEDKPVEVPFDLPDCWEWVRWGNLSDSIQYGYNAPAKVSGRIKMVRISDIHDNEVDWSHVPFCDIDEDEIETYRLKENDILFARTGGTVGKSYLVKNVSEEAIYAGYLIRTRYSDRLSSQYLKYFMESPLYWVQLRDGTIATAQPNCNGQTLSKMILPLPPLAEQQRIVDKINEIFANL